MKLVSRFATAAAMTALAFTLGTASSSSAQTFSDETAAMDQMNFSADQFDAASAPMSDDIYAVIPSEARPGDRPGRGGGGPGHGGPRPGGPGPVPPPAPGWGGGHGPGHGGPGWGGGHGGGWGRPNVQCMVRNARGMAFFGNGWNFPQASQQAMWQCQRVSRRCFPAGCR